MHNHCKYLQEESLPKFRGEDVARRHEQLLSSRHGVGRTAPQQVDHARRYLVLVRLHQEGEPSQEVRQEAQGFHLVGRMGNKHSEQGVGKNIKKSTANT